MTARTLQKAANSHTDAYPAPRWEQSPNPTRAWVFLKAPGQRLLGSEPCTQPNAKGSISHSSHLTASLCASKHHFSCEPGSGSFLKHVSLQAAQLRLRLQIPARCLPWQLTGRFSGAASSPSAPCPPSDEQTALGNETVILKKE